MWKQNTLNRNLSLNVLARKLPRAHSKGQPIWREKCHVQIAKSRDEVAKQGVLSFKLQLLCFLNLLQHFVHIDAIEPVT